MMKPVIHNDETNIPRYLKFLSAELFAPHERLTPQERAHAFLERNGQLLALPLKTLQSLAQPFATLPEDELAGLRFEIEKRVMDTVIIGYTQSYFGLPVIGAGASVALREVPPSILSATSTVHHEIQVDRPNSEAIQYAQTLLSRQTDVLQLQEIGIILPQDGLDESQRDARLNAVRLVVFRFDANRRQGELHQPSNDSIGFQEMPLPTMPLPPLPATIHDGKFYVALEIYFTTTTPPWGRLNWVVYIDITTKAILQLRPLVSNVTGAVFLRDPITKGRGLTPSASNAQLDPLRDAVTLPRLSNPSAGIQTLTGEYVTVVDVNPPTVPVPTTTSPFDFTYHVRTNDFAATNAYFHCDRFFQMVRDINIPTHSLSYFVGTTFPVQVDHRDVFDQNSGITINAYCAGNSTGNGIGLLGFALADVSDTANPLGISADWRVVLHELGGHGILLNHVNSPFFGFAHSAGDSFAAILNDPESTAPDRFVTFPWINIGRRHDRTPADGWG